MFSERIQSRIIDAEKTIIQAMKYMDEARTKSLLVFEGERFMGMVTNGDLQRAIIANRPFSTPIRILVANDNQIYGHIGDDIHQIKKLM